MARDPASRGRCLAVWAAVTLPAGLLAAWLLPHLAAAPAAPPVAGFEDWLVLGCEAAAVAGTGWLWLLVTLVSVEAARGTGAPRGVPSPVRRLVLAACGVGLAAGAAGPAYAASTPSPLDGLPLPDRPTSHARPTGEPAPRPAGDPAARRPAGGTDHAVRVVTGDSLWALAAAGLPDDATPAEVDARWRAIHAANREVIGEDPDLILPGQQLRLPPAPPVA